MWICYIVPVICLLIIHVRITVFLRQQSRNIAIAIKKQQQRDLAVIRRIFINVGVLLITGLPSIVIGLMALVTGKLHPLGQRITFITMGISFAILSIEMIFTTPQLKRLILRRYRQNQVVTMEYRIEMRPVSTIQWLHLSVNVQFLFFS